MIAQKLIFIGRTGVGKSSLINYFSGTSECETDKYRPCTKESKVVITEIHGVNYELIDTPGLGEGGAELDHLYLEFIDQYLIQDEVSPIFVFKSDDSRLRSEDYSLLQTLCARFGNRIFNNCSLFLTFAGNLEEDYYDRISKRVQLITTQIYKTQRQLGHKLFPGFKRIELIDSSIEKVYKLHPWEFEKTFPISPEVMIASSIQKENFEELGRVLGIESELCKGVLETLITLRGSNNTLQNFGEWSDIAERLSTFPFHHTIEGKECPLDMSDKDCESNAVEPISIYEVAELLLKNEIDENKVEIKNSILSINGLFPYQTYGDSERYINCIAIQAFCYKEKSNRLKYVIRYGLVTHYYLENGEPDTVKMFEDEKNVAYCCLIELEKFSSFLKSIRFPSKIFVAGQSAMEESISNFLGNEDEWENFNVKG